jgi:hypothetical protein
LTEVLNVKWMWMRPLFPQSLDPSLNLIYPIQNTGISNHAKANKFTIKITMAIKLI